jgi:hypothetical protein
MQETVRKITNGSGQKIIGLFYSHKMGTHVPFESVPERNFFYSLEFDKTVRAYLSQPATIEYWMDDKLHRYTPDVEVQHLEEYVPPRFVDIKPSGVAGYKSNARKFAFIEEAFAALGAGFEIISAESVECYPRLRNLQLLYTYADEYVPESARLTCLGALASGPAPLEQLAMQLDAIGYSMASLYALIFRGELQCDLDVPIDRRAMLSKGGAQ